jgi:acetyl esterase/lipase
MLYRLALAGWHVFTPSYRLSPDATFPDHLMDIKRSIAWVRSNAEHLGVDTDAIAIAGGSSGGNLAALAALTENDPTLQPGFEEIDTSLSACIPLYGVHDMLDADGAPLWPYLATTVLKSDPRLDPDGWAAASPIRMVTDDRPAFFVVHGANDTLVDVDHSRRFVDALRSAGGPAVGYLELPDANHGYDFFAGVRGRATAAAVVEALEYVHDRGRVE